MVSQFYCLKKWKKFLSLKNKTTAKFEYLFIQIRWSSHLGVWVGETVFGDESAKVGAQNQAGHVKVGVEHEKTGQELKGP